MWAIGPRKVDYVVIPSTLFSKEEIWRRSFPNLKSEDSLTLTKLNSDNIEDIVVGYSSGKTLIYFILLPILVLILYFLFFEVSFSVFFFSAEFILFGYFSIFYFIFINVSIFYYSIFYTFSSFLSYLQRKVNAFHENACTGDMFLYLFF